MLTKDKYCIQDILGERITREEAYKIIVSSQKALELFNLLEPEYQEEILDFIQGLRGRPILFDGF